MKKSFQMLLKILVSGTLLTYILIKEDITLEKLASSIKLLDLRYAPLILLLIILNYVVGAFRWKSLLIHGNADKITVKYLINLYFVGAFFNNVMPTTVGGDAYKVVKLGRKINNTVDAFSATFMERFTGVIALVLISIIALIKQYGIWGVIMLACFFLSILVGYLMLGFLSGKYQKLKKLYDSISVYRGNPKVLWWAFTTSFIIQLLAIFTQYFVFLSLGRPIPLVSAFLFFPLITLAGFVIPSINGFGVQETLYVRFFSHPLIGLPEAVCFSASIVYQLFRLAVSLIGGVFYAMGKDD